MQKLEDLAPTSAELDVTTRKGMPEQAAIGFIQASRRGAPFDLFNLFQPEPKKAYGGAPYAGGLFT